MTNKTSFHKRSGKVQNLKHYLYTHTHAQTHYLRKMTFHHHQTVIQSLVIKIFKTYLEQVLAIFQEQFYNDKRLISFSLNSFKRPAAFSWW